MIRASSKPTRDIYQVRLKKEKGTDELIQQGALISLELCQAAPDPNKQNVL